MPELRHDPIQNRWVIISTERGRRPHDVTPAAPVEAPHGGCPFCNGNEDKTPHEIFAIREPGTAPDSAGWSVRVVPNKFPALKVEGDVDREGMGQYDRINGVGAHEVIIETPEHDEHMADMSVRQLTRVFQAYRARLWDLMNDIRLRYLLIFKNYGFDAGASLAHPHSQLIATPVTPRTLSIELTNAKNHYYLKERCLFCDIIKQELADGSRIVSVDDHYITFAPYASRFPFELCLMPVKHRHAFSTMNDDELERLARHFREVLRRVRKSLSNPGFNFMLHTAPNTKARTVRTSYWQTLEADWHWHIEFFPRLTRVAGFEWGTGFYINPTAPEDAADYLRQVNL